MHLQENGDILLVDIAALEENVLIENFKMIAWKLNIVNVPDNELCLQYTTLMNSLVLEIIQNSFI